MFMNSWAKIFTSTANRADDVDPGEDGGTIEKSVSSDSMNHNALSLTLGEAKVPVDLYQGKVGF